jgi:hypothetical protein
VGQGLLAANQTVGATVAINIVPQNDLPEILLNGQRLATGAASVGARTSAAPVAVLAPDE